MTYVAPSPAGGLVSFAWPIRLFCFVMLWNLKIYCIIDKSFYLSKLVFLVLAGVSRSDPWNSNEAIELKNSYFIMDFELFCNTILGN